MGKKKSPNPNARREKTQTIPLQEHPFSKAESLDHRSIKLTMRASLKDWETLFNRFGPTETAVTKKQRQKMTGDDIKKRQERLEEDRNKFEALGNMIFVNFVRPFYEEKIKDALGSDRPKPRGIHAVDTGGPDPWTVAKYFGAARAYTAAANAVVSYWRKWPRERWPAFFEEEISAIEAMPNRVSFKTRNGKLATELVVAHLVEKKFGSIRRKLGQKKPLNFRDIYLKGRVNKNIQPAKHIFEKDNYNLTIDELYSCLPPE